MYKSSNLLHIGVRFISTNASKRAVVETVNLTKKEEYYKTIGEQQIDAKPEGWDEARPFETIPGPEPIPVLGNTWRFLPLVGEYYQVPMHELHAKMYEQYGKTIHLKSLLGQKNMIFLYDPDDIETVLRNQGVWPIRHGLPSFMYYRNHVRADIFKGIGGVLSVQGEDWFKIRSVVNPILMQPRITQQYVGSMDQVANDLINNIRHFSNTNPNREMPEDFLTELYKWTMESMGVIAFNRRLGCLDLNATDNSESKQFIKNAILMFECMYKLDVLPSPWRLISTPTWRKYVKVLDYLTNTCLKYIEEGLNQAHNKDKQDKPEHEKSVLERLAKIDKKIAMTMTIDMMIAGIDTTGRTMGAALYFLARHPEKQEALRQEILRNVPDKTTPVTKEIINESPYLKAVIKETTRLAPIAIGNLRTTVRDLVLGGYRVPKGTEVVGLNLHISSDEKYFKRSKEFIPERWLRSTDDELSYRNVHQFVHLPFGFGPRSCVGKRLANMELEVGLAKVVRNFKMSWPHEDMKFDTKLLYGIDSPLKIKVEELQQ